MTRPSHLSLRAHRLARELEQAIAEGNTRRVLELVPAYGLPRAERLGVCRELDTVPVSGDGRVELRFDSFDHATVRTVADVWATRG